MPRVPSQKRRPAILASSVAVMLSISLLLGVQKAAADEYYDGTFTTGSGISNGAGGGGPWDTTTTNWVNSSGNTPAAYDPTQTAFFATGGGVVTLGSDITFTTLQFNVDGYSIEGGSGPFKLSAASTTGTISIQAGTVTIDAQLTGSGVIQYDGSGTIKVTNTANDYTGGTIIGTGSGSSNPTLAINSDSQLGASGSTLAFGGGTLQTTASITTSRPVVLNTTGTLSPGPVTVLELDGTISGAGSLVVTGPGAVTLGNAGNSYSGGTTITNAGNLSISADGDLGNTGGGITFSGGTLTVTNSVGTTRSITLSGAGVLFVNAGMTYEIAGQITGSGSLALSGTGTVQVDGTTNTYTGPTNVNSGTLSIAAGNALSTSSAVSLASGTTLALNGFNQAVASLSGNGNVVTSGGTLTAGSNGASTSYFGSIQGTGGFIKTGTGTMTLNGANTYTGNTTVNGGRLIIDPTGVASSVLTSSSKLVMAGGTFQQNGVTGSPTTQVLNGLTVNGGQSTITVDNVDPTTSTTLDLRGTSGTQGITHNSGSVDFDITGGTIGTTVSTTAIIKTHQANDSTGIIGGWATVNGGSGFAANDGSDNIVAYNNYTFIAARGAQVPNKPGANVQINSAGTTGDDTLEATTTNINTLSQNTGTDSTIDLAGGTLRLGTSGGILITTSGANLTIGTTANPGTLTAGGATTNTAGQLTLNNSSTASLLEINSAITDNGTGVVSVVIAGNQTTAFAGANTYTGSTTISTGTLRLDAPNSIPSKSAVIVNSGATLNLNNNSTTVGSIADGAGGGGTITLGTGTLTVGGNNTSTAFSGLISSGGSLVKTGTGTLTLSNIVNSYTGGTTLNSGRLNANGSALDGSGTPLGTGTLTINGGTLGTSIEPSSGSSGTTLTNAISVNGNFSIATNVDSSNKGAQNITLNGTINLNGTTRTITGIVNGGQVHFGAGGIGVTGETAGLNLNTTFTNSGDYVAFILDSGNVNHYTGLTTVNSGAFLVFEGTTADGAIKGNLDIEGNGVADYINGSSSAAQISPTATVTVNSSGNTLSGSHFDGLELRGASDTIGALNGSGTVGLGGGTLTVGAGNFTGVIENGAFGSTGSLIKDTAGTLTLSGANTYTGATTISAGTLQAGAVNTIPSGSVVTVGSGSTLDLHGFSQKVAAIAGSGNVTLGSGSLSVGNTNSSSSFSGAISGTGGLTKVGTGTLTLTGTNTYTGPTTVTRGTMIVAPTGTTPVLSSSTGLVVGGTTTTDGGTFQLNGIAGTNTTQVVSGLTVDAGNNILAINTPAGTTTTLNLGSITRNANGFVDFRVTGGGALGTDGVFRTTQANTNGILGGWATVNNGSDYATNQGGVIVALSNVIGPGGYTNIAATHDTVPDGSSLNVRINSATPMTVSPGSTVDDIIMTHPVTSINTLTQNFATDSTINLAGGILQLGSDGGILVTPTGANLSIGAAPNDGVLTAGNGTVSKTTSNTITLSNNSANTLTINSAIKDDGLAPVSVRLAGSGTGTTVFAGTNTYSGSTNIVSGTLQTNADNALGNNSAVTINSGATLNVNGHNQTVGSISDGSSGGGTVTLGSGALNTGGDNTSTSFSGAITGTGTLTKLGTGTLTLSGTSTYSGGTTLSNGGLIVNSNNAVGTGTVTIAPITPPFSRAASGVTFGSTVNNTTLTNNIAAKGDFSVSTSGFGGNFILNGNVDLNGGTRTITGLTDGGQVQFGGTISNGGVTLNTSFTQTGDYVAFIYNGANTYTGLTTVNNGAFLVFQGSTAGGGTKGNLDIEGNGVVDYFGGNSSQLSPTATVTVNSGGNTASGQFFGGLDLFNSSAETIGTLNGSVNGVVALGAANLSIGAGNFAGIIFDGAHSGISGGQITKIGSGTLFLSGQNFYTGGTNVNAGILEINSDASLGSSSGALNFNGGTLEINGIAVGSRTVNLNTTATVQVDSGSAGEWDGLVQGSGGIVKTGNGDLFITNASNTFSGATTINAGQLLLSGAVNQPVTVNSTGTFVLQSGGVINSGSGSTPVIVNKGGTFSNFGNLSMTGAGSVGTHLTGANSFLDNQIGAVLSADKGVLVDNTSGVATVANFGTITGTNATPVAIDARTSTAVVIGDFGIFNGAVLLNNLGANTIVLATQYLPPGSNILPGSAGPNDTLELAGSGVDTLNLAKPQNFEYLHKVGGGMWTLTGAGSFSSGTLISGGTINLQGNLSSNVRIESQGVLAGTGNVAGSVTNLGVVMPGTPSDAFTTSAKPGLLTVRNNYTQGPQGALILQVNSSGAGQYSQISIGGHAQLDGALAVEQSGKGPRLKLGQQLTVLTANGGVNGRFSEVILPALTIDDTVVVPKVVYEGNRVALQGAQGSFAAIDGSVVNLTSNQRSVAQALDSGANNKGNQKLLGYLDTQKIGNLPSQLDKIAPEEIASVFRIGVSLADVQAHNIQRRTADLRSGASGFDASEFQTTGGANYTGGLAGANGPSGAEGKNVNPQAPDQRWGAFIKGVGDFAHVGDTGNARGYDMNTGGVTVGADYRLSNRLAVGVTAGYTGTDAKLTDNGHVLVNGGKTGVYGTYFDKGFYVDAGATVGVNNYSTRRASVQGDAYGHTDGAEVDMMVETGYDWRLDALTIGPTASFQYTYLGIDGFTEHGSLAPLRYESQHQSSIRSTIGMHVSYDYKIGKVIVRPEGMLAWQHEYGDRSYAIDSTLAGGSNVFSVSDPQLGRDSFQLSAGVSVLWNPRTSTFVYYDADLLKKEYDSQGVTGGLRMNF